VSAAAALAASLAARLAAGPVAGPTPSAFGPQPAAPASATSPPALAAEATPPALPVYTVPAAHTAGLLIGMRLGVSLLWPEAYDPLPVERSWQQYKQAWTRPPELRRDRGLLESDGDPWTINVLGHGLFGAEVYGRVRQCGGGAVPAFAFAAGASVLWEYGLEATAKRPSAIDLMLTPLLGAALGEGRYRLQRWLRTRPPGVLRRAVEIVIDPLGEGERGLLGTKC
jgi:hypothetical protein